MKKLQPIFSIKAVFWITIALLFLYCLASMLLDQTWIAVLGFTPETISTLQNTRFVIILALVYMIFLEGVYCLHAYILGKMTQNHEQAGPD